MLKSAVAPKMNETEVDGTDKVTSGNPQGSVSKDKNSKKTPTGRSSKGKSASSSTAKSPENSLPAEQNIMQGLNELRDLQQQSLTSMNEMVKNMSSSIPEAILKFLESKESRKRKSEELSDEESDTEERQELAGKSTATVEELTNDIEKLMNNTGDASKDHETDEDEILSELSKLYQSEGAVSDPINTKLASLVDKMVKTSLSGDKAKEKLEKYNRPENCENLVNTKVNPEIWSKMRPHTRSRDLKMQKLELTLLKSMIPISKLCDKLLSLKGSPRPLSGEEVGELLQQGLDALTLTGHSVNELNLKRRELIKPDLNDQYKQLCGSQTAVTKLLFGDDLPKSVKEITETNKVGQKVSSKTSSSSNSYSRHNVHVHNKRHASQSYSGEKSSSSFLYRGQGHRPPRQKNKQKQQ